MSDAAFAERMFRETVVWKTYLDHVIGLYSRVPLKKLDQSVLASLRIGAVQLLILETPSHAAVSATVEAHPDGKSAGLVNAVLRKVSSHRERDDLPLHIRYSHPVELVSRWVSTYGKQRTEDLLKWNNSLPELGGYAFCEHPPDSVPGRYLEGYRILNRRGRFTPPEGFYIQDESAALVGRGMAGLPGGTVLEIGAAPGGKTAHLQATGSVFSLDSKPDRMERWVENSARLHWKNALGVCALSSALPFSRPFAKVVVDAPCSNTGVYRRRHDARWKWSPEFMEELVQLQTGILDEASRSVEMNGTLVYSTCSLEPEENGGVVGRFEVKHPGFQRTAFPGPDPLVNNEGFLSYFPPDAGIDGLFAAAWVKRG